MISSTFEGAMSYTVKVRAKTTKPQTYLFGSSQVDRLFEAKFVLVMRVDPEGETIKIKAKGPGNDFDVCTLEAGQTFAMQISNIKSVWAEKPDADTRVHCALAADPTP